MFDIGFWELLLIAIVAMVVIGPERMPGAIRSVGRFIGAAKGVVNNVKDEISQELKIQELQEQLKEAEKLGKDVISSDLKSSINSLKGFDINAPISGESKANNSASGSEKNRVDDENVTAPSNESALKADSERTVNKEK